MKLISILTMAALAIPCSALADLKAEVFSGRDVKSHVQGDIVHIPAGTPQQLTIAAGKHRCLSCRSATEGAAADVFFSLPAARAMRRFRGSKSAGAPQLQGLFAR